MNLTRKNFEFNKNRKNGISGGDFTTIDKYFEELNKGSETEQGDAWKSEKNKKTKKRKKAFKLRGQNQNKKSQYFYHKPKVYIEQYSPIGYR